MKFREPEAKCIRMVVMIVFLQLWYRAYHNNRELNLKVNKSEVIINIIGNNMKTRHLPAH